MRASSILLVGALLAGIGVDTAGAQSKGKFKRSKLTSDVTEGTADRRKLLLATGEDRTVDLDFEANASANGITVGNPGVVAFTLVKVGEQRQIVFKPLKAGDSTVTVRDQDGVMRLVFDVRVTGTNLLKVKAELLDLLRDVEGIDIRVVGQKVVIDGEVLIPNDYGRIIAVASDKSYADLVINLTSLSAMTLQVLAKRIQEDINSFAPNVKTRVVNGVIFLEGTVDSGDQATRAGKIASYYLPEAKPPSLIEKDPSAKMLARYQVQNFIVINPPAPKKAEKLVRVTVHFVELSKDYNKIFGFKWQPGFTSNPTIAIGQTDANGVVSTAPTFTATLSSLFPKLMSAQTAGYARVLKSGTVVVRSGQPAAVEDIVAYPVAFQSASGTITAGSPTNVGLKVNVTPKILGQSEEIELNMILDQTNLVGRSPSSGGVITAQHKVTTNLYVKNSESAAVAGVNNSDTGTDFNKDDPQGGGSFEGGTDPLFSLLRSKAYRKKKSQFVIFVTPQILDNASEGTEDLKKNFRVKVN